MTSNPISINRRKMNNANSVLECDFEMLMDEYRKVANVRDVFKKFNINYTSNQIIKFAQLRHSMGCSKQTKILGLPPVILAERINKEIHTSVDFTDLARKIGCHSGRSLSTDSRKKLILFCEQNKIDISILPKERIYKKYGGRKGQELPDAEVFCLNSNVSCQSVKNRFLKKVEYRCEECHINEWNGKLLVLALDHINGNSKDNRLSNLRLLCPNCHSQTNTFSGANRKRDKKFLDKPTMGV